MINKIKKNLFIVLGIAVLIYLVLAIFTDIGFLFKTLKSFNWLFLPLLLLFSYLNYVSRFFKWHYYVRQLKINISLKVSFEIFMSGLAMSLTPGKMGEVLKAYMLKKITGIPISKTAPIIFVERVTDFLSLVFLAIIGAVTYNYGVLPTILVGLFFISVVLILSSKKLSLWIIDILSKIKFIGNQAQKLHQAYESSYNLLKLKPLVLMVLFSLVAWMFECIGFYFVLYNFKNFVSLLFPIFVYSFSTIIGSVSMLPGGLGVTEGSLTLLLANNGFSKEAALASTFIIRTVTLWFALLIGVIHLFRYQKKYGEIKEDKQE